MEKILIYFSNIILTYYFSCNSMHKKGEKVFMNHDKLVKNDSLYKWISHFWIPGTVQF